MRFRGTLNGKLFDKKVQKRYEEGEVPSTWDCAFAEIDDVEDEAGNYYGTVRVWLSGKLYLRMEHFLNIPDNDITFDATAIEDDIVKGFKNACPSLILCTGKKPITKEDWERKYNEPGIGCDYCAYYNKPNLCNKYKVR